MSQELPIRMTPLAEGAAMIHEFFLSLVAAGFTEYQAGQIIGVMLAETGRRK